MAELNVTGLDFDAIKTNLKTFLRAQSEFSDYDFEGSALSVLIDTLAYNTHYNAVMAHMVANENFLDTAVKRSSVVSISKALGYIPRSVRGSTAVLNMVVTPADAYTSNELLLSRNTAFTTTINNTGYIFYPRENVISQKENRNGVTAFYFDNLAIIEGIRVANNFLVDSTTVSGPFIIPNPGVDTTTLRVRVQKSATDFVTETYKNYNTLVGVSNTTKAYYIEENFDGLYQVSFGDNVIGKKLAVGNVVLLDYITSKGSEANKAKSFLCGGSLTGTGESKSISLVSAASGGKEIESIDSIRVSAPRFTQAQNRVITVADYKQLILSTNSNIRSCAVWGGEANDPPMYGKVFISLTPQIGQFITQNDKDRIQTEIITPKSPVGILAEFADPDYTYINLKVNVLYDPKKTTLTSDSIKDAAISSIQDYFNLELNVLNKNFYLSRIHDYIKKSSTSIISVNVNPKLQKRFSPIALGKTQSETIKFSVKSEPRTLHSTWFKAKVNEATYTVKLIDEPLTGVNPPEYVGLGKVHLQNETGDNIAVVGAIDYVTGRIVLKDINVVSYIETGSSFIRINLKPHDDIKDISTEVLARTSAEITSAVVALASRNTVLSLDDTTKNVIAGARLGLEVITSTYVEDD